MFSQLGPLFKTTFRQAESNDTRQKIPHEERDDNRQKQNEEEKKESNNDLWEDSTNVSVDALRAFLINFLGTLPEAQDIPLPPSPSKQENLSARPPEARRPTNTKNAKAVRAYQSIAAQSETPRPQQQDAPLKRPEPSADMIESKELRDIYTLIDDLDILVKRGVQDLNIQKADSFVESLKNAVKDLL